MSERESFPEYVVHEAGEPHEGTQACRRCGEVIVEQPVHGEVMSPTGATEFAYFEPGLISRSPDGSVTIAGALPGARVCRL